jgi:hypothetical protein
VAKAPGILGGKALTAELRKLAVEAIDVAPDGTPITREQILADLIWKQALGWTETWWETDSIGNRVKREMKHKPVPWAQQYLFERMEGRAAQATPEDVGGVKAAEKVRQLAKDRINNLARITAGPPMPKGKP